MKPVRDVDQLGRDPQLRVGPAHAALQDRPHPQLLADGPDVIGHVLKRERGRARRHAQRRDAAQGVQNLFRHAVAEVPVLGIGAEIHERQHSDRVLEGRRCLRDRACAGFGQPCNELCGRGKPICRRLRERARHCLLEPIGYRVPHRAETRQGLEHLPRQNGLDRPSCEGWVSRQHLVEHAPEAVEIATAVELVDPLGLFRAHVAGRTQRDARPGGPALVSHLDRPGDAEVAHNRMAGLEENVLRLDVAMYDVPFVRIAQSVGHLAGDAQGVLERELPLADQSTTE